MAYKSYFSSLQISFYVSTKIIDEATYSLRGVLSTREVSLGFLNTDETNKVVYTLSAVFVSLSHIIKE